MQSHQLKRPSPLLIQDDLGVITLRQEVRALARTTGLDLGAQAKITAAISGVVRVLLDRHKMALVKMVITPNHSLEIRCGIGPAGRPLTALQLWQILDQSNASSLVDLLEVIHDEGRPFAQLTMRCGTGW